MKARSMRGEIVDFDLIRIKQQMASAPRTTSVKAREDFIERRLRRRVKKINPLTKIQKGVAQTPQQPVQEVQKPKPGLKEPHKPVQEVQKPKPGLKELPNLAVETKSTKAPPVKRRKKISRKTK